MHRVQVQKADPAQALQTFRAWRRQEEEGGFRCAFVHFANLAFFFLRQRIWSLIFYLFTGPDDPVLNLTLTWKCNYLRKQTKINRSKIWNVFFYFLTWLSWYQNDRSYIHTSRTSFLFNSILFQLGFVSSHSFLSGLEKNRYFELLTSNCIFYSRPKHQRDFFTLRRHPSSYSYLRLQLLEPWDQDCCSNSKKLIWITWNDEILRRGYTDWSIGHKSLLFFFLNPFLYTEPAH